MNKTKTYFPVIVLITGLLGLFVWFSMISTSGLIPHGVGVENEAGETVITISEAHQYMEQFVKERSAWWAMDLLSIYLLFHGAFWTLLNSRTILQAIANEGKKSFILHLLAAIPLGATFWFVMYQIISKTGMLLHQY